MSSSRADRKPTGAFSGAAGVSASPMVTASAEVGAPSGRDLALLKVPDGNYPMLPLADSTGAQIGDPIRKSR